MKIAKIIIHEDYCVGNNEYDHDIALVKLKEKVDVSIHTPACLPPKDADYSGKLASVYGWGVTKDPQFQLTEEGCRPIANDMSQVLMEATLPIMTTSACKKISGKIQECINGVVTETNVSFIDNVTDDMVCGIQTGQGHCYGDSGGPFTVEEGEEGGQHTLVGVTSWAAEDTCGVVS